MALDRGSTRSLGNSVMLQRHRPCLVLQIPEGQGPQMRDRNHTQGLEGLGCGGPSRPAGWARGWPGSGRQEALWDTRHPPPGRQKPGSSDGRRTSTRITTEPWGRIGDQPQSVTWSHPPLSAWSGKVDCLSPSWMHGQNTTARVACNEQK